MLFIKRNASTILTCIGGAGVVVTTVMAVKATPKAVMLLEEAEQTKGEELTKIEKVQAAGPVYIPTVLVGAGTLACIFGANVLGKRSQAALTSAYALLDRSYKEYRTKAKELYGEDGDAEIREEVAKDNYEPIDIPTDEELFYDEFSKQYFTSTKYRVKDAAYQLNRDLSLQEYVTLNTYYEYLGMDPIDGGDELGWTRYGNFEMYWQDWVDLMYSTITMDDGTTFRTIAFAQEPYVDFEDY